MARMPFFSVSIGKEEFQWQGVDLPKFIALLTFGFILWRFPTPSGLETNAWHLFIIFICTIIAIMTKPLPIGGVSLCVITLCAITKTLSVEKTLSSFSSHIVWLVFVAFLIARGFIKTGLGTRIAYLFMARTGKTTLGLSYGMIATELLLAPLIPSNTARGGGIIFPLINSLNNEYKSFSDSDESRHKLGAYLIQLLYHANTISSCMFLTAMAANPLIVSFAKDLGIEISWGSWALAACVPGLISLAILPPLMMILLPPTIRKTPHASDLAREKLKEMGALSFNEIVMMFTFGLLLSLWILNSQIGIHPTVAALTGLAVLLFSGVLTWEDVLNEKNGWNTFLWLSVLLMLSEQLNEQGVIQWFSLNITTFAQGLNWVTTLAIVGSLYYLSHYFFASMTAHVSSMFGPFLLVALAAGSPPLPTIMLLAAFSSLSGGLTHYGTGTAPIFYGAGYVTTVEWWRNGFIISVINICIWCVIGFAWWKAIGLW